ncbi:MAG: RNA polymerase sigma factor [Deltaproteobacteria bacterium]|nr:RNA polymerase sigma factor [Deltaproteobacteria bacterium]
MDGAGLQLTPTSSAVRPTFASVYTAELRWVWRTLWRLGVRDRDLEDVAHDVFVVVHRKLEDFDPTRPLRPWLFGICFRTALDRRRKHSHSKEIPTDEQGNVADDAAVDVTALIERKESKALVQLALASLPLEQRAVFVLHELEGAPIPECVAVLEAPLNTLYSRLRLARAAFSRFVQRAQP